MKVYRHFYIRDEFVCDRIQSENEWKIIYSRNNLGGGGSIHRNGEQYRAKKDRATNTDPGE